MAPFPKAGETRALTIPPGTITRRTTINASCTSTHVIWPTGTRNLIRSKKLVRRKWHIELANGKRFAGNMGKLLPTPTQTAALPNGN